MSQISIGLLMMAKGHVKCSLQTLPIQGTGSMLQSYVRIELLGGSRHSECTQALTSVILVYPL